MSTSRPKSRLQLARLFARRMQAGVAAALRSNIVGQRGRGGEPFARLFADVAVFPNKLGSDRAGKPALIDSGELVGSIRPGMIVREGRRLRCFIVARDYGMDQHRGFASPPPNLVGRTLAARQALRGGGPASDAWRAGDVLRLRGTAIVPPRPWISVSREAAVAIASAARKD